MWVQFSILISTQKDSGLLIMDRNQSEQKVCVNANA